MKFTQFRAVLFSIGWMSVVGTGYGPPPSCCLSVTNTKPPFENIVKYDIQDPRVCGIRAARFYTKKNTVVCSDPDSKYAKKAMDIVNRRTTTTPIICYTSTTNTIPAVTTTNKTTGKKTETSTSTIATRIVTRIETSTPETVITKTTNQEPPMSKENPKSSFSTATCGTDGPTSSTPGPGTVTHLTTTDNTETTSPKRTKPSKLKIKILKKNNNKKLRRFQMNIHRKDTSG